MTSNEKKHFQVKIFFLIPRIRSYAHDYLFGLVRVIWMGFCFCRHVLLSFILSFFFLQNRALKSRFENEESNVLGWVPTWDDRQTDRTTRSGQRSVFFFFSLFLDAQKSFFHFDLNYFTISYHICSTKNSFFESSRKISHWDLFYYCFFSRLRTKFLPSSVRSMWRLTAGIPSKSWRWRWSASRRRTMGAWSGSWHCIRCMSIQTPCQQRSASSPTSSIVIGLRSRSSMRRYCSSFPWGSDPKRCLWRSIASTFTIILGFTSFSSCQSIDRLCWVSCGPQPVWPPKELNTRSSVASSTLSSSVLVLIASTASAVLPWSQAPSVSSVSWGSYPQPPKSEQSTKQS